MALTALASGVVSNIDPWTTFLRGAIAFLAGHFAGSFWDALFGIREQVMTIPVESEDQVYSGDRLEDGSESEDLDEEVAA